MKRLKNILLFAGTSDDGEPALKKAVQLAEENGASLTVLDVVRRLPAAVRLLTPSVDAEQFESYVCAERQSALEELCARLVPSDVTCQVHVVQGPPVIEIIRTVLKRDIDLVLKTADGGGFLSRSLFGSIALQLMRKCPCPVWILRPDETPEFDRVIAAVDAESEDANRNGLNDQIIELATSIAEYEDAELHVVQSWQVWMESTLRSRGRFHEDEIQSLRHTQEKSARDSLTRLLERHELSSDQVTVHLVNGVAGFLIPELVRRIRADLLVMGTVCRTGVPGFLIGNTAEKILNDVNASVLAVKPDGFESPVSLKD